MGHITVEEPILDAARKIFSLQLYLEFILPQNWEVMRNRNSLKSASQGDRQMGKGLMEATSFPSFEYHKIFCQDSIIAVVQVQGIRRGHTSG